jgi:hypothetical protein
MENKEIEEWMGKWKRKEDLEGINERRKNEGK